MKFSHEIACAAAEWWASKIVGRYHHDNGDNSPSNVFAMFLADSLSEPVTEDQITTFKNELVDWIENRSEENVFGGELWLGSDYSPGFGLREAIEVAGISEFNIPFKTSMYIRENEILVCDGYASPPEQIYPAKTLLNSKAYFS